MPTHFDELQPCRPSLETGADGTQRFLIIHCDDLGMCRSVNRAAFLALDRCFITSVSVMVPCPFFYEVVEFCSSHPNVDIGIHLTLTSEWSGYRWGPISPISEVRSLVDSSGHFPPTFELLRRTADPIHVAREIRAQIVTAVNAGIRPSHVDCHMFVLYRTRDFYEILSHVSREFKIPYLRIRGHDWKWGMGEAHDNEECTLERLLLLDRHESDRDYIAWYSKAVKELPRGCSQMIVHLGYDDAELEFITKNHERWNAHWRQLDFTAVSGADFQSALSTSQIRLATWQDLRHISKPSQKPGPQYIP